MKKLIRSEEEVLKMMSGMLIELPSPSGLSYFWNFGSLLGVYLIVQIFTGLFLAIHFSGDVMLSFSSVVHIMRDVNWGWMIRVIHSNGASMFFMFLYFHVGRGLYYGSFSKEKVWMSGVTILLLSMATAFLGYVLPWGQMSFWAATVITNLLSVIPYVGGLLVEWVWGGFAVSNPTLTRFFAFHFLFPFVILGLVMIHLMYLHVEGSGNPLGLSSDLDSVEFHSYYSSKDMVGVVVAFMLLVELSLLWPYMFMDSENFIPSNSLVTPTHIQPEWYFLFAYFILRSITSKIGGVVALAVSVMVLYVFPYIFNQGLMVMGFYLLSRVVFWMIVVNWILLTWIGACVVESPFMEMGGVFSFMYFFLFFLKWVVESVQDLVMK
uniref:Cytochrome b n=1 Tax=Phyxioschema suthepium TaxID=1155482 RepID=L7NW33_9ARAC|nr:cytochrome b [Phyxioschema suthepium]AFC77867.1 cytochrome b [Phyxioschema suthepium]